MSDNGFGAPHQRNPFGNGQEVATRPVASLGALASAEQQRALGELQAQIMLARMNPRDPQQAVDNILRDCSRVSLAQAGQYEYARGGTNITGPSIKLMEAIARRWGNLQAGFKVIHSENGSSDVITYAWDLETGFRDERQFQVQHVRDTRKGPVKLTDERDIYELIANNAQRRKRACLIAVIPADVVEAAVEQCQETLSANVDTSIDGLKKLLKAFSEFQVTQAQIEQRIQCRLDAISPGQVTQLSRIYASLKDGISVPSQFFRAVDPPRQPVRQNIDTTPTKTNTQKPPAKTPETLAKTPETPPEIPETPETPTVTQDDFPETGGVNGNPEPEADAFAYSLLDEVGQPIDGEVHLDPLVWAQAFMNTWNQSYSRSALLEHNADALADARAMSPEADALLDDLQVDPDQRQDDPAGENPVPPQEPVVDRDEQIASNILQTLPTLKTPMEVIEYSKSPSVMQQITRWQAEGQAGRVTLVRSAFTSRLNLLKKAGNG